VEYLKTIDGVVRPSDNILVASPLREKKQWYGGGRLRRLPASQVIPSLRKVGEVFSQFYDMISSRPGIQHRDGGRFRDFTKGGEQVMGVVQDQPFDKIPLHSLRKWSLRVGG
jgi:hypothetical protein